MKGDILRLYHELTNQFNVISADKLKNNAILNIEKEHIHHGLSFGSSI